MKLLVDIGNTRIKWALDDHQEIVSRDALVYQNAEFVRIIQQVWLKISAPTMLVVASVGKLKVMSQLVELAKKLWPNIIISIVKTSAIKFSVHNAYKDPSKLGVDRWLGIIALQHYYSGESCIIDCGTAITIDAINTKGHHLGGLISPGLQLMQSSLSDGTEKLMAVEQSLSVGLANFTESAIYSGTVYAATGLIEKVIGDLCASSQNVILTGGDAEVISQNLNCHHRVEPDFIFKGLSLYSQAQ